MFGKNNKAYLFQNSKKVILAYGGSIKYISFVNINNQRVAYEPFSWFSFIIKTHRVNQLSYFYRLQIMRQQSIKKQEFSLLINEKGSLRTKKSNFAFTNQRYLYTQSQDPNQVKIQHESVDNYHHHFHDSSKSDQISPQMELQPKKSSQFHNFQKHLMTTLRTHIEVVNLGKGEAAERLAAQLWRYFIRCNRPTKRFLYSILTNIPENIVQYKLKYRDRASQEQFQRILKHSPPDVLRKAQEILRRTLRDQCQTIVDTFQLDRRRIKKIQQFKEYFGDFIHDLEKGEMSLRMPKKKVERDAQIDRSPLVKLERNQ